MIYFSPVRTPRLQVELHELTAYDAIYLCQLPIQQHSERGAAALLKRIINPQDSPIKAGQVIDPRLWTVQERALVIAHYLAHVIGDDFAIGRGRYSHYLMEQIGTPPAPITLGSLDGKTWRMYPLLGFLAESIERLIEAGELTSNRAGWMIGAMAAQLVQGDQEPLIDPEQLDSQIDQQMTERATALLQLPESEFMALTGAFFQGTEQQNHIFKLSFGHEGLAFLPVSTEVPDLPPARFPFSLALREDTTQLFGTAA